MKITTLTYGLREDVQPIVVPVPGLQRVGYSLRLAAPHRLVGFVVDYCISFYNELLGSGYCHR